MQKSELTSQSSAQLVYLVLEKLLSTKMDLSTVSRTLLRKFCLRSFRLGNHWSHRHLNRQAAGDFGPDRAEQHMLGADEPDRGCGRGPDHLRRGGRGRALQGLGEVFFLQKFTFLDPGRQWWAAHSCKGEGCTCPCWDCQ